MQLEEYFDVEDKAIFPADNQIALEWLAVLSALDIHYHLQQDDGDWVITVAEEEFERARSEITDYESERKFFERLRRKITAQPLIAPKKSWASLLVIAAMLVWFRITGPAQAQSIWIQSGKLSSWAVLDGEWWRIFTALTLHADFIHVFGNIIFLYMFTASLCFRLGAGMAWLLVLLGGALGNLATAGLYNNIPHHALGSSTGVFAALGLLGTLRLLEKLLDKTGGSFWTPLFAALALLGFTGVAGGSDVTAHFCGFVAGMLLAIPTHFLSFRRVKDWVSIQIATAGLTIALLIITWKIAKNQL